MDEKVTMQISNEEKNELNSNKATQYQYCSLNTNPASQSFSIGTLGGIRRVKGLKQLNKLQCRKQDTVQAELQKFRHFFNHSRDIMLWKVKMVKLLKHFLTSFIQKIKK